jgi:pyruvate kinase
MSSAPHRELGRGRRAKIICTLGPSTDREGVLEQLMQNGMDAARLNLSFGDLEEHVRRIQQVRALANSSRRPVAIIADLPGRKVRLGRLEGGRAQLETGDSVRFFRDAGAAGNATRLPIGADFFHENMTRGDQILLADGVVELVVTALHEDGEVEAEVVYGGAVGEQTGVLAPGMPVRDGPLTAQDEKLLKMAVEQDVDYIALTYITDASDILQVRERLETLGKYIPIIAKIERSEAFARLDGILRRADAVMIRRGDLGAEIEVSRVPLVQKEILRLAAQRGVPVIIATQMLGSMIASPNPTRAEASDVANAIVDGADGVLLSAETASGKYPVESVRMMSRIIGETERERHLRPIGTELEGAAPFADVAASIACEAAQQTRARLIACFTESGQTARLVAKYRPAVPILAFCSTEATRRRLSVMWGVRTDRLDVAENVEAMVRLVEERLAAVGLVRNGDRLVIVFGAPVGVVGHTNSVRLHEVGSGQPRGTQDLTVPG